MKTSKTNEIIPLLIGFVLLVLSAMLVLDVLLALLFNQPYYFLESLLFKVTIVLLFIPIGFYQKFRHHTIPKSINISKILAYLIPLCVLHVFVSSWLIALIAQYLLDFPFTFRHLIKTKFTNDFVFLLTIYGLMYLMARYYSLNLSSQNRLKDNFIRIKTGTKIELLEYGDIDWICAETPYVGIWIGDKKHLQQTTLNKIIKELNCDKFARIHRSTIVNMTKIKSIQSRANGDYDVLLYNKKVLRMSRSYSKFLKGTPINTKKN